MTIGESMKAAREKAGLSMKQLADLSGIQRESIFSYEKDLTNPLIHRVEILADTLGISVDEYIGHEVRK